MNWLVYHIASGHAFFSGLSLLAVAAITSEATRSWTKRVTVMSFLIGVIAIVVSSTPTPSWFVAVWVGVTAVWIASRFRKTGRRAASVVMLTTLAGAALIEIPYHISPSVTRVEGNQLAVLGDSVTAGVGGSETAETWPSLIAREHNLEVQDVSHVGETAASALGRVQSRKLEAPVLIVEIGGNDLLGSTSATQFAKDLDALLAHLASGERQIVMFELPLPPFCHAYGSAQRTLAAKYNVLLVPKRVFLSVIADDSSTLDSIHLSQSGHQLMADCVWRIVGGAYNRDRGE